MTRTRKQVLFKSEAREKFLRGAAVLRVALETAASVAGVMLMSEATLTEVEEPGDEPKPDLD